MAVLVAVIPEAYGSCACPGWADVCVWCVFLVRCLVFADFTVCSGSGFCECPGWADVCV